MKCASCGRDSPAGARFCIHCGVEQSPPTPIAVAAAAAAAMHARNPVPRAANAPRAGQAHDDRVSTATRHQPDAWGGDTQAPAFPAGSDAFDAPAANAGSVFSRPRPPAAIPVYASHPRRLGTAALLIAACVIVALLAFVAWKLRQAEPESAVAARDGDSSVMAAFPPDETPQRTPRAPDAPASSPLPEKSAPPAVSDATPASPVEIKPLPPARPAHRTSASAGTAPVKAPPAPATVPAEPAPTPERPAAVAAAPKAPVVDRWSQMSDELSRCTREDFISRVVCDQRVRFRYCNGYWGKVAQCPGNPAPERGQ